MPDETLIAMQLSLMGRVVKSYRFGKPVITVGRDPESDVVIDNPGVSREHLRLERAADGEYEVADMGSANGTFLNDLPVRCKIPLRSGDCVRFGKYTLTVAYERDRRSETPSQGAISKLPPVAESQTVVLSKTELNRLLTQQAKAEAAPPPTPPAAAFKAHASPEMVSAMSSASVPPKKSGGSFASAFMGFIVGAATSAAVMWVVLR